MNDIRIRRRILPVLFETMLLCITASCSESTVETAATSKGDEGSDTTTPIETGAETTSEEATTREGTTVDPDNPEDACGQVDGAMCEPKQWEERSDGPNLLIKDFWGGPEYSDLCPPPRRAGATCTVTSVELDGNDHIEATCQNDVENSDCYRFEGFSLSLQMEGTAFAAMVTNDVFRGDFFELDGIGPHSGSNSYWRMYDDEGLLMASLGTDTRKLGPEDPRGLDVAPPDTPDWYAPFEVRLEQCLCDVVAYEDHPCELVRRGAIRLTSDSGTQLVFDQTAPIVEAVGHRYQALNGFSYTLMAQDGCPCHEWDLISGMTLEAPCPNPPYQFYSFGIVRLAP